MKLGEGLEVVWIKLIPEKTVRSFFKAGRKIDSLWTSNAQNTYDTAKVAFHLQTQQKQLLAL